ncbi:MAG: GNAT family N-acetyltransferase [Pseudomonadota bacterium]
MNVRLAKPSERRALEELQTRASLANSGDRDAILANPDAIQIPQSQIENGQVFVAERDGAISGFAAILPRDDGDIELDGLFVEPAQWKTGVGRRLVGVCASRAKLLGAKRLCVTGNPHAEGFYLSCGFAIYGTMQTRFGPGLLMQRPLI